MGQVTGFELILFYIGYAGSQAIMLWWIFEMGPPVVRDAKTAIRDWRVRMELRKLQNYADPPRHCRFVSDWLDLWQKMRAKGELEEIDEHG